MSTRADDIQIDLDPADDPAKPNGQKEPKKDDAAAARAADEATGAVIQPDEGIEKLKKQLADEQTARVAADERARRASEGEARARGEVQGTQLDLIKNALESTNQTSKTLRAEYAAALAAQDYDKVAEIQDAMSTNAARKMQFENAKVSLERAPKPQPQVQPDLVEEYAGRLNGFPRSAQWVRSHPEYVRDPQKNRLMIAAHDLAMARGLTADTDDYFDSIERTLDLRQAAVIVDPPADGDADPMKDSASKGTARKGAPPAAPVSRTGNGAGGRPGTIRLTPEQREVASQNGMTDEEYAKNLVDLRKEGRLN